jgi:MYXO-CTERM domain-containing protein
VTTYAYVSLVVTAPPAQSVDGGQVVGGGGSFSWPTLGVLALGAGFAALRRRRVSFRSN